MNARDAAWMAPSPVPANTAITQNCALLWTKYAAATTAHHWASINITTRFGPQRVGGGTARQPEERRQGNPQERSRNHQPRRVVVPARHERKQRQKPEE